jgi:hypothetical protein
MSVKHLNNKYPNINWSVNKKNIYGFDNNTVCKNITVASLLMETNQLFNNTINYRDTLCDDYKINNTLIEKVDIIFCDMPVGIRNFKFANACNRIKQLKYDGTKAEPLFLQLILQSLNKNGRAAIIVPDNLLDNNAKLHTKTRQYLIENLNLKKIVSIDSKLTYSGIKQSIIYFENTGKTEKIEFSKIIIVNNKEKICEEKICEVKYDEINKTFCYLYPAIYTRIDKPLISKTSILKIKDMCSCSINNTLLTVNKDSIIITNDSIIYVNSKNTVDKKCIILELTNETVPLKYIYYYLVTIQETIFKNYVNINYIYDIEIPILSKELISKIIYNSDLYHKQIEIN